jgi:hypothetical protein
VRQVVDVINMLILLACAQIRAHTSLHDGPTTSSVTLCHCLSSPRTHAGDTADELHIVSVPSGVGDVVVGGPAVGDDVGELDGVGDAVGCAVGHAVGVEAVGDADGEVVGARVGGGDVGGVRIL